VSSKPLHIFQICHFKNNSEKNEFWLDHVTEGESLIQTAIEGRTEDKTILEDQLL